MLKEAIGIYSKRTICDYTKNFRELMLLFRESFIALMI